MRILITGSAGYIGSVLLEKIDYVKHSVKTVDRYEGVSNFDYTPENIIGDLTNPELVKSICENIDCIIHLAGEANVRSSVSSLQKNNMDVSALLIKYALAKGVNKIIYLSTIKSGLDNEYARSKYNVENILKANVKDQPMSFTILQSATVYGSGMKNGLAKWLKLYKYKYFLRLPNSLSQLEMIGVNDLCEIILKCVENPVTDNKTYKLNDGQVYTINGIDHACMNEIGREDHGIKAPKILLLLIAIFGTGLKYFGVNLFYNLDTHKQLFYGKVIIENTVYDELGYYPKENFYMQLKEILN